MRKFLPILSVLFSLCLTGQVLLPTPETAFEPQHNFSPEFIKKKGIRKITFEIIDKKDFEVAIDRSLTENYEFNKDGLVSRYYYTSVSKCIERQITTVDRKGHHHTRTISDYLYDTVSTSYFYSGGNLMLRRYHDGASFYEGRYYRYDSDGHLVKEQRYKETNNSPIRSVFILGNQVMLSEDSFQYRKFSSGQVKCIYLNNENRPYKEKIVNVDSLGRVKNTFETYTAAGWMTQEQKFEYRGGKLAKAHFEGNTGNVVSMDIDYEYDAQDELYGEKHYKNGELIKEVSYITDKEGLLNSFVIRDPLNRTMRIVRLRYDFGLISKSNGKRI